jgi:SAM-dependent methyltransferase
LGSGAVSYPADERFREAIAAKPRLAPYERLAAVWHDFSPHGHRTYERFLKIVRRRYEVALADVLDVACGSGALAAHIARDCRRVVGIDRSPYMLAEARKVCAPHANVQIAEADFRSFALGEAFDAVICAFDSINYLDDIQELKDVFERVGDHLRPGGFFLFDALPAATMRGLAQFDSHSTHNERRYAMCSYFDETTGKSRTLVVFPDGVEEHVRVPIDRADVCAAAERARMVLLDAFSDLAGFRRFYVLRKPARWTNESRLEEPQT